MPPTPAQQKNPSGPSDAALVLAARAGERWAQEALFRRYARMVNGLAYRLLGRDSDVDDLVQTSFLSALKSLDRLAEPQAFASWLASIVVRTAHKVLRRRRMLSRLGMHDPGSLDLDRVIAANAPATIATELREVYTALEKLAPEARIALVLHRVDGMSIPEIADRMRLSASTVKRRLRTADEAVSRLRSQQAKEQAS